MKVSWGWIVVGLVMIAGLLYVTYYHHHAIVARLVDLLE